MSEAAALAAQARFELDEAWSIARATWRDTTAEHYGRRFQGPVIDIIRAYGRAAERLEDAIDRAETIVRD